MRFVCAAISTVVATTVTFTAHLPAAHSSPLPAATVAMTTGWAANGGSVDVSPHPGRGNRLDIILDWWGLFDPSKKAKKGSQNGSVVPTCTWGDPENRPLPQWYDTDLRSKATLLWRQCPEESSIPTGWVVIPHPGHTEDDIDAPVPVETPDKLGARAVNTLVVPDPEVSTWPTADNGGYTLVNARTWWWVHNSETVSTRSKAGPLWVEVTATPTASTWVSQTGDFTQCDGLGIAWDNTPLREEPPAQACTHTYRTANRHETATLQVTWDITYRSNFGPRGTLTPLVTAQHLRLPVLERHALTVR